MAHFPTYELQYKVFRWTGMAKNDFETRTQRVLYGMYEALLTLSYTIFQLAFGFELTVIATELSFEALLLNGVSFLLCLGVLAKRMLVLGKKQQVKDLYLRIKKDFESPVIKDVKEAETIIRDFENFYKKCNGVFYLVGCFVSLLYCMPSYLNFPKEIPFPIPFQEHLNPTQLMVVIVWQTILIWVAFINYIAYDSLVWGFLMLIAMRLQIVAKMCENFAENFPSTDYAKYIPEYQDYPHQSGQDRRTKRKYHSYDEYMRHDEKIVADTTKFLKESVVYYQEITEEMGTIEKVYSFPLLIHMVGGAILIGIIIVSVIIGGFNTWFGYRNFTFFFCTIADLFNFSYYGTKINEAKEILVSAVYGCPWYEGDVSNEKLFLYAMSMTRIKIQYTAGGFVPINFESYLSLMKLSYNLWAVLK